MEALAQDELHPRVYSTPERHSNPVVKVRDIAYIEFERVDLADAAAFFRDFGLEELEPADGRLYLRAAGPEHHCIVLGQGRRNRQVAIGLHVNDAADLRRLAAVPGASAIEDSDRPGGGRRVSLHSPDGLRVDAIYGRTTLPEIKKDPRFALNWVASGGKLPRLNEAVRLAAGPSKPYRLGHTVQSPRDVDRAIRWYQEHFGFIVSDFQCMQGVPDIVTAFMRCDLGATPTDHHTLAIGFGPVVGHLHSAFECHDLDDLMGGHVHLQDRRRRHSWGIGRHMLGSQIFDYWRDPAGDMFEHYADGDRFDSKKQAEYSTIRPRDSHHQWGPPMTDDFLGTTVDRILRDLPQIIGRFLDRNDPLTPAKLWRVARGISSSQKFYKHPRT